MDELAKWVDLAMAQGARGAEVLVRRSHGWRLQLAPGAKKPSSAEVEAEELTIRVWVDAGRFGSQTGRPDQAEELLDQALASTFESPEDRFAGPVERIGPIPTGLGVLDRRHERLELEDRVDALRDIARQAGQDERFGPEVFTYEDAKTWRGLANSRGIQFEEEASWFRLHGAIRGQGLRLEETAESRAFASIISLPLGTRLLQRGDELLRDGQVLPKGPVRVVLPPLPMARLLAVLGEHFTPEELSDGSFFLQDRDGARSVSDQLHVVDDGQLPGGLRTRAFDDRGSIPVPVMLLQEGAVAGRFLTPEKARSLETRATGHVYRDGLRANNLVMRAGTRSINALLTEIGGPSLIVDDLPDLSGLDRKTGDFEARVDAVVMEANDPVGAMRGVTLRGNLRDLFNNVLQICNNTDRIGHVDAASIIADGLELA